MKNILFIILILNSFLYSENVKIANAFIKATDKTDYTFYEKDHRYSRYFAINYTGTDYCSPAYVFSDYNKITHNETNIMLVKFNFSDIEHIEIENKQAPRLIFYTKNNKRLIDCEGSCLDKLYYINIYVKKSENLNILKEDFENLINLCKKIN